MRKNARGARQLALSKGPEWMGNLLPRKKDCLSKQVDFFFFINSKYVPALKYVCVQNKKEFSVQVLFLFLVVRVNLFLLN